MIPDEDLFPYYNYYNQWEYSIKHGGISPWRDVIYNQLTREHRNIALYCNPAIEICPGYRKPILMEYMNTLEIIINVGSEWMKKNLIAEEFASFVVDRMNGFEKGNRLRIAHIHS